MSNNTDRSDIRPKPGHLLVGEHLLPLRCDFSALADIEDVMGSVDRWVHELGKGNRGRAYRAIIVGVSAMSRQDPDRIAKDLKPRLSNEYRVALLEAFNEAMGVTEGNGDAPEDKPTSSSPGATSTTSPPSDTDDPTASSGP